MLKKLLILLLIYSLLPLMPPKIDSINSAITNQQMVYSANGVYYFSGTWNYTWQRVIAGYTGSEPNVNGTINMGSGTMSNSYSASMYASFSVGDTITDSYSTVATNQDTLRALLGDPNITSTDWYYLSGWISSISGSGWDITVSSSYVAPSSGPSSNPSTEPSVAPEPSPRMGSVPNLTISSMEWDNEIYSATPTGGSASSRQWYYKAYSSDSWHSFTNNSAYYTPSASEVGYSYQVYYSARSGYRGSGYSAELGPIIKRNISDLSTYAPVLPSTTTTVGDFPGTCVSLFLLTIKPVFNTAP